jgi:adenylate kinase family enzyme
MEGNSMKEGEREGLRLVIASPGDVQRERDAVERVVAETNKGIGAELGYRLDVLRWETDAFPGFHLDGPQGLIDEVLDITNCDILVGIFWKRFGTPTMGAESGTEHEIKTAYEAWRSTIVPRIMLYFNEEPYSLKAPDEAKQLLSVLKFRELASEWGGLYWTYNGLSEFEALLRQHLTGVLRELRKSTLQGSVEVKIEPDSRELQDRREYIARTCDLISKSLDEVILFTARLHRSQERWEAKEVNRALRQAYERGVSIRILVGHGYDGLPGVVEIANVAKDSGIAVRFNRYVHEVDINYEVFDRKAAIIAARNPSQSQKDYKGSFAWVEFTSRALATSLVEKFERWWTSPTTRSITQHLQETLPRQPAADVAAYSDVAEYLGLPEKIVAHYVSLPPARIFLIGRPGSGKSTVAKAIQGALKSDASFGSVVWLSDVDYLWRAFRAENDERAERMDEGGYFVKDPTLFHEALEDLAERARRRRKGVAVTILEFSRQNYLEALRVLAGKGVEPDIVVYLDVSLETALHRNKQRSLASRGDHHYVSEREMRTTFATDDLRDLKKELQGRLFVLAEPKPLEAVQNHAVQILEHLRKVQSTAVIPMT